jgi:hypothetical protein
MSITENSPAMTLELHTDIMVTSYQQQQSAGTIPLLEGQKRVSRTCSL